MSEAQIGEGVLNVADNEKAHQEARLQEKLAQRQKRREKEIKEETNKVI